MQTKLAMFEYLFASSFHNAFLCYLTTNYFLHIKRANHNPLIGKLHNAMSLRNQEYYGHTKL
jgi:hypothetical protein